MPNDFLSQLIQQSNTLPSPLMTEEEKLRREEEELRKEDPTAFSSAIEDELEVSQKPIAPPITQKEIDTMKEYPRSPAEDRLSQEMDVAEQLGSPVESDNRSSVDMLKDMIPEQPAEKNKYQEILEAYRSLRPKQEGYENQLQNLAIQQGMNQIAQGMARGYGAEIGAGEEGIKALKEQAAEPLNAIKRQMDTGKQAMGLEDEMQMMDPGSDVSKFYREQAYALLKKLKPDSDYTGKLENMSASQLQKLPGMKNLGASLGGSPWIATDRVDEQGNPIRFNKVSGEYSTSDGRIIKPGDYTARDILRRDPLTGQYAIGSAGVGMKVLPTQYSGVNLGQTQVGKTEEKPREVTYGEFARNAPEQAKQFNKLRDDFNKDMKDSREVASSVTNLASKLKPGPNGEVDSGLLGGIQTQAAKMAGQKGVLTDQDLVKFAGAGGVAAKLERIVDGSLFGDMTDDDIKFFKRFANLMGKSLNQDILNRSQLYVEQGRQLVDTTVPGVTSENISKMLGVDKVAPIVQNKQQKPKAGSIITVKGKRYQVAEDGDTLIPINK